MPFDAENPPTESELREMVRAAFAILETMQDAALDTPGATDLTSLMLISRNAR